MGILKIQGEKTTPDFIEEDFISAIETAINRSIYYQDKCVEIRRISQSDENELGYDGVLSTLVPFYIQFKRSDFYSPQFRGQLAIDRNNVSLPTNRGFFAFELLKKNNTYEQHNAMFRLSQHNKAAYVAPMFYKSRYLSKLKSQSNAILPVLFDDIFFHHPIYSRHIILRNLFFFKGAITIPPHNLITDNSTSHHYSYSRDNKVGFHSEPINLEDSKIQNLYYFLRDVINEQKRESKSIIDLNYSLLPELFGLEKESSEFAEIIEASIKRVSIVETNENVNSLIEKFDTIDKLRIIEDILYHYFGITQYVAYESA